MVSMTASIKSISGEITRISQSTCTPGSTTREQIGRPDAAAERNGGGPQHHNAHQEFTDTPLCPHTGSVCAVAQAAVVHETICWRVDSGATGRANGVSPARPQLSAREKEVLIAWLRTDSKIAVGQQLYITAATVRTHIQRIREKYDSAGRPAPSKAALTVRAIQDRIISTDDL